MQTSSLRGLAAVVAVAAAMAGPGVAVAGPPGEVSPPPASRSRVLSAIELTRQRGVPTVLILTSRRLPSSTTFGRDFLASEWTRRRRGLVQVVEASIEDDPLFISGLKVTQYPTAVVFCRSDAGLSRYETSRDCDSVASLSTWLGRLVDAPSAGASVGTRTDRAVVQATHRGDTSPSPQAYAPPCPQPCAPASLPVAPQSAPAAPAMVAAPAAMATTMANVVSVPSPSFVIQPQAPQIFMAPAQAPVMYVPQQAMAAAPASAPASNLFLPAASAAPAAAPVAPVAAQPTMVMAAQPAMAVAAQPTVALAAAQPTQMAAVTNQQLSLPTADSRTRVRVRGPGLLASAAARLGQRLTQLGRASIITEQVTTLAAPLAQAGAPGMTTVTTTSAVPLAQAPPQQPVVAVPPAGAPPTPPPPPVQRPSPQGYDRSH